MESRWLCSVFLALGLVSAAPAGEHALRLAVANTAAESGLVDVLIEVFKGENPQFDVELTVSGGLVVLETARQGSIDAVLTHHPDGEQSFLAGGYGLSRTAVLYSRYAILGPPDDPLNLRDAGDLSDALRRIAENEVDFLVPGEKSGTYQRIAELWRLLGVEPDWLGYESTGTSAGATVRSAALFGAYTFADWSTYLTNRDEIGQALVPLYSGDGKLRNQYSLIVVNPLKVVGAHREAAETFLKFLLSERGQQTIVQFGREHYRMAIFEGAAL